MNRPFENIDIPLVARQPRPGTVVPAALSFTRDDSAITYLFSEEGSLVRSLWHYDIATRERTVLAGPPASSTSESALSREEELRRERARQRELGVTSYEFAKNADVLLIPAGGRLSIRHGHGPFQELDGIDEAVDPHLSPDGTMVAYVRGSELFVAPTDGSRPPLQLTNDASATVTNGLAEFVAQEELDRSRGFWWSPDGSRIAFARVDNSTIPLYPIVHQGKADLDIEEHRYPFAGAANVVVQLGVVSSSGGAVTWMDLGEESDVYLARVAWQPDGALTAVLLSRDQRTLELLRFDEDGSAHPLLNHYQKPWINLDFGPRFLDAGGFVWTDERTGFRHIYLYDAEGREIRELTSGEWAVTSIVFVDESHRRCFFIATRDSVLERHLYTVSLEGGEIVRLTDEPGWHSALVSHDGSMFIDVASNRQHGPRLTLRSTADGGREDVIFANPGATAEDLGLEPPELVQLAATDGTALHGALYRPRGFTRGTRYPLLVSVYGGPHVQLVADDWSMTVNLRAQYLAQHGFAVFQLDNRGSSGRGLAFEAAIDRNMGSVEVEDQATGVRWLIDQGIADRSRVGIFGWSYGGYMTIMSMLREPNLFRVGVAGAPVTDWDGYDTAYTERYMATPATNPGGYRASSALTYAANLSGKLLLVHGMVDENVHFRHTARFIRSLTDAGKEYDLLIFPEERHMPRDQRGLEYQERVVLEYFQRWLGEA